MDWLTVNQWTPNRTRDGWYNTTFRQVMQAAEIEASGTKVRFTFRAGADKGLRVTDCFVGKVAGTDPAGAEFMAVPTRVTFGGVNGFTLAAGASIVSDEIDFAYDSGDGDALAVSWFMPIDVHVNGSGYGRVTVDGTSLHWVKGNYADAMPGGMDGNIFRFHEFAAMSVVETEIYGNSDDAPTGITKNYVFDQTVQSYDWQTIYTWVDNATSTNWRGYTTRWRVDDSALQAAQKFRLVAKGHPTQSTTITACVIAEGATNGNAEHGYKYAPIPVTWNGGDPGFTIGAGVELISDIIELVYDPITGCPLVVGTWIDPSVPNNQDDVIANNTDGRAILYYKTGNDLTNLTPTGYSVATADDWLYIRIEAVIDANPYNAEVSKLGVYAITSLGDVAEVSKLSTYAITNLGDLAEVSKFNLYAIARNVVAIDYAFDYEIESETVQADYGFDYRIEAGVEIDYTFDYQVFGAISKDFIFDYSIIDVEPITRDFEFDYRVFGTLEIDMTFDYWIAFEPPRPIQADYSFGYGVEANRVPFALVPDTPVVEVWSYATARAISYDGTEQRAALRSEPRITLEYRYVLDELDRAEAFRELMTNIRGEFFVPLFANATETTQAVSAGSTTIYCDLDRTDIRVGDTVYYVNSQGTEHGTAIVLSVGTSSFTVINGVDVDLPLNSWVMGCRPSSINDGSGIAMTSMSGESSLTFTNTTRRSLIRPTASSGLVAIYDGLPYLDKRPLADDDVEENFTANVRRIVDADDVIPASFATWRMPIIDGERTYLARRPDDLDYWREFAQLTKGQQTSFLTSTFRPDLLLAAGGAAGAVLEVQGVHAAGWFNFDAYTRLRLETDQGVVLRKIIAASVIGGNTQLTIDSALPTSNVSRISYLNRVRLAEERIQLEHEEMHTFVTFAIQTVNE